MASAPGARTSAPPVRSASWRQGSARRSGSNTSGVTRRSRPQAPPEGQQLPRVGAAVAAREADGLGGTGRRVGIGLARREAARDGRVAVGEHDDLARHAVGRVVEPLARGPQRADRVGAALAFGPLGAEARERRAQLGRGRARLGDRPGRLAERDHAELEPVVRHAVDQVLERAALGLERGDRLGRAVRPLEAHVRVRARGRVEQDHDPARPALAGQLEPRRDLGAARPRPPAPARAPAWTAVTSGQRSSRPTPATSGPYARSAGHSRRIRSANAARTGSGQLRPGASSGSISSGVPGRRPRRAKARPRAGALSRPAQRTGPRKPEAPIPPQTSRELSPTLTPIPELRRLVSRLGGSNRRSLRWGAEP